LKWYVRHTALVMDPLMILCSNYVPTKRSHYPAIPRSIVLLWIIASTPLHHKYIFENHIASFFFIIWLRTAPHALSQFIHHCFHLLFLSQVNWILRALVSLGVGLIGLFISFHVLVAVSLPRERYGLILFFLNGFLKII